jgi:hypothetical protein
MHTSFRIGNTTVLASDGRCEGRPSFQGFSLSLTVPNDAEAERVFASLADGGQVQMPLTKTFFASRFEGRGDFASLRSSYSWSERSAGRVHPAAQFPIRNQERSMVKIIALVCVVLVAALLVFAVTKPDTFRVQRAASIKAPPEKIFALINDLHSWGAWSPYEQKDPGMKRTLSGAANGKGAVYEWEGNQDIGKERMEITDTSPPSKVIIKLDFVKPFEAHNIVEFTLEPNSDSTHVT